MIDNKNLKIYEREWLETMLSKDMANREHIIYQINSSQISREQEDGLYSIIFIVDRIVPPIVSNPRVPVEMRVFRAGKVPVQFLLHILNGYVHELEIFNADSSKFICENFLDASEIEVIVDE